MQQKTISLYLSLFLAFITLYGILSYNFITILFSIILTYMLLNLLANIGVFTQNFLKLCCNFKNALEYLNISKQELLQNRRLFVVKKTKQLFQYIKNIETNKKTTLLMQRLSVIAVIGLVVFIIFTIISKSAILINADYNSLLMKLESILISLKDNKISLWIENMFGIQLDHFFNLKELKKEFIDWTVENIQSIQTVTKGSVVTIAHIILGMIIGILIFSTVLMNNNQEQDETKLSFHLTERISVFYESFKTVFSAQIKISLVDTTLTAIYLLVILPLFDIELPFKYSVLILVFTFGLIPIVGNLVSNTIIFLLSLSFSWQAALISLLFLVVIHKFEYFLNAKFIGDKLKSSTWELLIVMIVAEHIFGLGALILSPFYYAYIKNDLKRLGWL